MTAAARASGHLRVLERAEGPVFYARIRADDGSQLQRRLGPAWTRRSRPPEGSLTRAQAERRLAEIIAGADVRVRVTSTGVRFAEACEEWIRWLEQDRKRRPSTTGDYRNAIRSALAPEFGPDTPLEEITTERIDGWRERMVAEGRLSPRTINKRLIMLHGIFARAHRQHGIPNPVVGVERQPHRPSGDFQILDPDGVRLLAAHAADDQDGALYTVAAFTGLRLGELLALRWADVDFAKRIVHVRWSLVRGRLDRPKSHKVRSVPLTDQAAVALDELSRRGERTDELDLVFANEAGEHLKGDALRRRYVAALSAAGLPALRFHDLRHTFGTLAVQVFPLTDVKAYMGHADVATTQIYTHHVPQHDAADRLSRLVARGQGVPPTVPRTADTGRN